MLPSEAHISQVTSDAKPPLTDITKYTKLAEGYYINTSLNKKLDMTEGAIKYDQDKPPLDLLSRVALEETAKVMAFGAKKYAAHNWRKGFDWNRPLAAAMRHIQAFNDGEDKDPESGLSHLAHAACCIMFLLEFEKTHPELDNRYKV